MSVVKNAVRSGFYLDSVALMRMSAALRQGAGVEEAVAMIGTEPNKAILAAAGVLAAPGQAAGPGDLIVAVRAVDEATAEQALAAADAALTVRDAGSADEGAAWLPRTLSSAHAALPDANLVLISTPGLFAAREALAALRRGLNVMLFSDNVPVEAELRLKREADRLGLLVMGPDCGTAYVAGVPLAFANVVARGRIGVVAASGTGLQELATLLDRNGAGIAHGLGVGGRDLSDAVGGLSTLRAIDWLDADADTDHIALISKPPGPATTTRVLERLARAHKPVTLCLLGVDASAIPPAPGMTVVTTLKGAAEAILGKPIAAPVAGRGSDDARAIADGLQPSRWRIAGLYAGGTLATEAQLVLAAAGLRSAANAPVGTAVRTAGATGAAEAAGLHCIADLGGDEYTLGRPHPMLEPEVRTAPLAAALADPTVAVVLLDVVLGYGAHCDPAGAVVACLAGAPPARPAVVASVCGTDRDPQVRARQVEALRAVGVQVAPSNADAAALAAAIAGACPAAPATSRA